MAGATGYHAGLAAEDCVARVYEASGHRVRARRWRGQGGEIDLILEGADGLVFVEVKKSRSFDRAVARFSGRQMRRICEAAAEFVAGEPLQMDTPMRFDLALVDQHGQTRVVENILH
ncbi:YraN family protein [Mangrovicoccus sp. HB161399]|uniref:YraN family protein n=1 Tax=Mangrovicoccus sp. HB161399 TaxID=2720392 RepID=UPI001553E045|nr:YraN family protein [Mangrovicoccus sp. HB161399]